MRQLLRSAGGASVLALGILTGTLQAQEWSWTGSVARGAAVEIRGVNGAITATASSGREVEIVAVKDAERSDPATVQIQVVEDSEGILVCAVYPDRDGKEPNRCARGDDYHMSTGKNDVQVRFTVRVPAGVDFRGHTVNGDVAATGLSGRVKATTVNGSIEVSTTRYASASTVNGSIAAELGSADWDGTLSFRTVNGGITLALPEGTSADVTAQTVNGDIETDFPLTVKGRFMIGMRKLEGQIGGGGERLSLNTVNGTITLRKTG